MGTCGAVYHAAMANGVPELLGVWSIAILKGNPLSCTILDLGIGSIEALPVMMSLYCDLCLQ